MTKPQLFIGEIEGIIQSKNLTPIEDVNPLNVAMIIYFFVSFLFLCKAIVVLLKIKNIKGELIKHQQTRVFLMQESLPPFSFFNTIFISKKEFENENLDPRIFVHEKAHIKQKHSVDILIIEFLKIISWCNPILFFYKKAMVNNHEFLADDEVLNNKFDCYAYQTLLLNTLAQQQNLDWVHSLYFNNLKHRIIMMTQTKSKKAGFINLMALPVFALLFLVFSEKTQAQQIQPSAKKGNPVATKHQKATEKPKKSEVAKSGKPSVEKTKELQPKSKANTDVATPKETAIAQLETFPKKEMEENVEKMPEFSEGINGFRKVMSANFDASIFTGSEKLLKTSVYFDIDETGKMGNVVAEGDNAKFNQEAERVATIASNSGKWTAAQKGGKPVKYKMKIPMTMNFQ